MSLTKPAACPETADVPGQFSGAILRRILPSANQNGWTIVHRLFLSTICLVGGWSSERPADNQFVERVAGMEYSRVERELGEIGRLDDSPIIRLGGIWKAKSALELLALYGERITDEQIETFFSATEEILSNSDPQLELPDDKRYMAAIYDKIRPQSELLIDSLCDTLIKLAVRGPDIEGLRAKNIEGRVSSLVFKLLNDADSTRWLSFV